MRPLFFIFFLLLISQALGQGTQSVDQLTWMSGHWTDGQTEETWSSAAGGTLLGFNRSIKNGKTVHFEFMRIETDEQGLVLWASPKGQASAAFRLTKLTDTLAVFENPEHDFPQQVQYERSGDTMKATVSAQGKSMLWTWNLVP